MFYNIISSSSAVEDHINNTQVPCQHRRLYLSLSCTGSMQITKCVQHQSRWRQRWEELRDPQHSMTHFFTFDEEKYLFFVVSFSFPTYTKYTLSRALAVWECFVCTLERHHHMRPIHSRVSRERNQLEQNLTEQQLLRHGRQEGPVHTDDIQIQ